MAYADQQMSGNKIVAIVIVALIHIVVGYTLVTGLAYKAAVNVIERVTTIDIEEPEPEPEEEPPPPPPEEVTAPPPPVAPPPPINVSTRPPDIVTQIEIPPPAPVVRQIVPAPPAPPPPPPPPPPRIPPKAPEPRGNPGSWAGPNDYPSRALREEREGTTRFTVTVGSNGRVESCTVTGSSGHPDLDEATCRLIERRGRFRAATDGEGREVSGTWSSAVRWEIPRR